MLRTSEVHYGAVVIRSIVRGLPILEVAMDAGD